MASKENQEALDIIKNKYLNICDGSDYLEICSQFNDCKKHNDKCDAKEEIDKLLNVLQQAIDDLQIKNVALERACSMVSFYEGMDYKYFVEKYVKEAKKDIKELKELENGKQ